MILEYAEHFSPTDPCREFEVAKSTFYEWKNAYKRDGVTGLKGFIPHILTVVSISSLILSPERVIPTRDTVCRKDNLP